MQTELAILSPLAVAGMAISLLAFACTSSQDKPWDAAVRADGSLIGETGGSIHSGTNSETNVDAAWAVLPLCPELRGSGCKIKIYRVDSGRTERDSGGDADSALSCEFPLITDRGLDQTNLNVQYTVDGADPICLNRVFENGEDADGWRYALNGDDPNDRNRIVLVGDACAIVHQAATRSVEVHLLYECVGLGGLVLSSMLL